MKNLSFLQLNVTKKKQLCHGSVKRLLKLSHCFGCLFFRPEMYFSYGFESLIVLAPQAYPGLEVANIFRSITPCVRNVRVERFRATCMHAWDG